MKTKPQLTAQEKRVIRAAIKWYDPAMTDCEHGIRCKKHGGVCQLMLAVRDLLDNKK